MARKKRVQWTEDDLEVLADSVVEKMLKNPEWNLSKLLEEAQKRVPSDKRRKLASWIAVPKLLEKVKSKLLSLSNMANVNVHELQLENEALREEIDTLRNEPQIDADTVLQEISTERLLSTILGRVTSALAIERIQLAGLMEQSMDSERLQLENRLYGIEASVNEILQGRKAAMPRAPESKTDNGYLPLVHIAGLDRKQYNRLHQTLEKNRVRLERVDIAKGVIKNHDLLVLWYNGLSTEQADKIQKVTPHPDRLKICHGSVSDLVQLILKECRTIKMVKR